MVHNMSKSWELYWTAYLVLMSSWASLGGGRANKNFYLRRSFEDVCQPDGSKREIELNGGAGIFTFSSSSAKVKKIIEQRGEFQCHLELEGYNQVGFHVYFEEMNLNRGQEGCQDYVQFGRDIIFLNSFTSKKYCGRKSKSADLEAGRDASSDRLYIEAVDHEMDVWLHIGRSEAERNLTLVVTTFRKVCGKKDPNFVSCPPTQFCIRKEFFCDGIVNCAWPDGEVPSDERPGCLELQHDALGTTGVFSPSNIPVIIIVTIVLLALTVIFIIACHRFIRMVKKPPVMAEVTAEAEVPLNASSIANTRTDRMPSLPPSYEEVVKLSSESVDRPAPPATPSAPPPYSYTAVMTDL